MGYLGCAVERELACCRFRKRDDGAWLDRRSNEPVIDELKRDDVGRRRKGGPHRGLIAAHPPEADIAGRARMQIMRTALRCGAHVHDRRQHVIVHCDALARIQRLLARLGNDRGSRLTHMPHRVARERKASRLGHGMAVVRTNNPQRPHRLDAVGSHVASRQSCHHAGHGARC
jgi:hypothetical protein